MRANSASCRSKSITPLASTAPAEMIACCTAKLRMKSKADAPSAAPLSPRNSPPAMNTRLPLTVAKVRAMSDEFVTTVSRRWVKSSRARKLVVVPVSSIRLSPSAICSARLRAIARLAPAFSRMRRSNGASPVWPASPTAPCTRTTAPASAMARTSRRTVSADTAKACAKAANDKAPCSCNSPRIAPWRLFNMLAKAPTAFVEIQEHSDRILPIFQ